MNLTIQEISHLLAALRYTELTPARLAGEEPLVAAGVEPLDGEAINALCVDLNFGDVQIEDLDDQQLAHLRAALEFTASRSDLADMDHFAGEGLEPLDEEQVYELSGRLLASKGQAGASIDLGEITRTLST